MAVSQNGWSANDATKVSRRTVPGTAVGLTVRNGVPGDLLLEVAAAFDALVQDIDNARGALDDWGYAERPIRGGTELSNHASGTAIDLNATRWPLGAEPSVNLNPAQITKCDELARATGGVVRWGGRYSGRKDPMHWELNDGTTTADCVRALAQLRAWRAGAPMPAASGSSGSSGSTLLRRGSTGAAVRALQTRLNRDYPAYSKLAADGVFGPATESVVREFQRRARLGVDGIAGPQTLRALGL